MTLNHLNLVVTDVARAVQFFETYFEFTCAEVKGDNIIAVLKNREQFVLVLMSTQADKSGSGVYPESFHIGFMFESAGAVDGLHQKLIAGHNQIAHPPKKIRDGYGFYLHFDNLFIEVGYYLNS